MPLVFLLFIAFATAVSAAYAGRDEVRLSLEPIWRMETFYAYLLFLAFVVVPTAIYFYVFHGDWFLFYVVDTSRAPWLWGILTVLLLLGSAGAGFRLGVAFCRASRDVAARRATIVAILLSLCVWPLAWGRLQAVGSYRQFSREYGLVAFPSSPACYSGIAMLVIGVIAFVWIATRISRQTQQPTSV